MNFQSLLQSQYRGIRLEESLGGSFSKNSGQKDWWEAELSVKVDLFERNHLTKFSDNFNWFSTNFEPALAHSPQEGWQTDASSKPSLL